jgi:hypothetical protein
VKKGRRMRNLPRKLRKIMALCILLLVSIIGMSFSSPEQEDIQGAKEPSLNNSINQYLGKWKGSFLQTGEPNEYPMLITVSQKETNEITAIIEWPWNSTTRGGGFVTQKEEGRFASKCISWTELDYIKGNKRATLLHGRYIANLVKDNELEGIYILAHNLQQGGTFRLSKVLD